MNGEPGTDVRLLVKMQQLEKADYFFKGHVTIRRDRTLRVMDKTALESRTLSWNDYYINLLSLGGRGHEIEYFFEITYPGR